MSAYTLWLNTVCVWPGMLQTAVEVMAEVDQNLPLSLDFFLIVHALKTMTSGMSWCKDCT